MSVESLAVPGPKTCTDLDARIGERIRARRELMRLTQTDVGRVLGISFQQLQKYEQGKNRICAASLQRVAELLGVPVASFYDEPGPVRVPAPPTVAEARAAQRAATEALEEAVRREAAARGGGGMTFWQHHGVLFLICAVAFPRLTLFFGTGLTDTFGVGGWLAWLVLPRFQIAYFATVAYGATNPFLVAVSWLVAVAALGGCGETGRRAA